jgi:hypothetical protein
LLAWKSNEHELLLQLGEIEDISLGTADGGLFSSKFDSACNAMSRLVGRIIPVDVLEFLPRSHVDEFYPRRPWAFASSIVGLAQVQSTFSQDHPRLFRQLTLPHDDNNAKARPAFRDIAQARLVAFAYHEETAGRCPSLMITLRMATYSLGANRKERSPMRSTLDKHSSFTDLTQRSE